MKRIIMFLLLFAALKVAGQTTGYLRFDTVKIMKQNGTCELYVINKTKDSLGLLTNVGGGLTRFIKSKVINDSTIVIGLDTLVIPGAGGTSTVLNNVGTGYNIVATPSGNIKRLNNGYGILLDSATSNTNTAAADTSSTNHLVTQSDLNDAIAGAGGGVTTLAAIGSSPNANGATISGSTLNLQPASESFGGVITADTQTIGGKYKTFTGPRTNFQGYSPIVNTQYLPTQVVADSIYNNRYIGFGGIDVLPDGTFTIVYTDSHNHIGDSAFLKLAKSTDQGRSWSIDTLLRISGDTSLSMGAMGVSPSGRLIVFYYKFTTSAQHGMFIIYSDDEGDTWSSPYQISNLTHSIYNPYGGLCKIADNKLLFSWYGYAVGGVYRVYSITSSDDGVTWSSSTQVLSNNIVKPTETMFTHLGGGQILGLSRSDSTFKYTQTLSRDNGVTWDSIGRVAFGHEGTPAWLKTYEDEAGKRVVVAYYRYSPNVNTQEIHAIYGYADSLLINGVSGWDLSTETTIVDTVFGSGYISIVHPGDRPGGYGYYYSENSPQLRSAIKFVRVPKSNVPPIGPQGIDGLTADRIPVVLSAKRLTDYSTLKFNSTNRSIVLNNSTVPTWSGYNAGVIETAKASIALNDDDGSLALMNNAYVNTDFRYKSNAAAGLMTMTSGRLHFYNGPSGALGDVISLTERFSVRAAGDVYFNNSVGTAGQVLTSGGAGAPPTWGTVVSSQWVDVTGGINYTNKIAHNTTTPGAPLHINGNTSGAGNYTTIISDDNGAIGMSLLLEYRSATGTNQRRKGFVMDNNGLNINKFLNAGGDAGTSIAVFSQADNFLIGSTSDNGARLQVNGDATVTDEAYDATAWNGSVEVPTKNALRDKLETMVSSLNSQTGTVNITPGTAINVNLTGGGNIEVQYDRTDSDVPHTLATYLTDVNNSGTSETDLYNTTVGANKLISNGQSIHFVGTVAENDINATTQIRVYFAGTEVANTGGISISGTGYLRISGEVIRTTSTTARASFKVEGNGLATDYVNELDLTGLDFTTTNVFKVTGTAGGGGGGSNDITAKSGKLTFQSN